jgi:hypothetical protein
MEKHAPQIDTQSILFSNVFRCDDVEIAESLDSNGDLILWILSSEPGASGTYDWPDHEDPSRPIRYTAVGQRLAAFSPATPGRCNAVRADGGHCRMQAGRCRFHDVEDRLF